MFHVLKVIFFFISSGREERNAFRVLPIPRTPANNLIWKWRFPGIQSRHRARISTRESIVSRMRLIGPRMFEMKMERESPVSLSLSPCFFSRSIDMLLFLYTKMTTDSPRCTRNYYLIEWFLMSDTVTRQECPVKERSNLVNALQPLLFWNSEQLTNPRNA